MRDDGPADELDPGRGWRTERLDVQPLRAGHAVELHPLLDDPALHEFIGGEPLSAGELTARFARWESRRSPDGGEVWANWVLREQSSGQAVGTIQATIPADPGSAAPALVAWVVVRAWQGRGLATEAARALVARLLGSGRQVAADIHPGNTASQHVARSAGLRPTTLVVDGEVRWSSASR